MNENWPRIKDLPAEEREEFQTYLSGQTCPLIAGLPLEDQDGYYPWDYDRFKRKLPVID
jgi:hypothetical protein